ncbi:MAG TPA: hypothetical protein PLY44_03635 [Candidatus Pacearchaeota archaeon]|nr:hypothetical protein [Candidatus Pacearchaeota archaeon]
MLKKRFYDILTIVYVLLFLAILLIGNQIFANTFVEKASAGDYSFFSSIYVSQAIVFILAFIYWLFILVLAIKLHKEDLTKTIDLVIITILVPLAPIFYLTNLRKSLKKYFEK